MWFLCIYAAWLCTVCAVTVWKVSLMCHSVDLQWTLESRRSTLWWATGKILTPIKFIIYTTLLLSKFKWLLIEITKVYWHYYVFIRKVNRKGCRLTCKLLFYFTVSLFVSHYRVSITAQRWMFPGNNIFVIFVNKLEPWNQSWAKTSHTDPSSNKLNGRTL